MNILAPFLVLLALPLAFASIFIATFLAHNRLWIAILCGFVAGLLAGFSQTTFINGLVLGLFAGLLFNLFFIPTSLLSKYYRTRGQQILRSMHRSQAYNPRSNAIRPHLRASRPTTIDLTDSFRKAQQESDRWSYEQTQNAIDSILTLDVNLVIQDNLGREANTWARLDTLDSGPGALNPNDLVGIIRYDIPLAILHRHVSARVKQAIQEAGFQTLVVPDLKTPAYRLQVDKISEVFPKNTWDFGVVDPGHFSIADLLFLTSKS